VARRVAAFDFDRTLTTRDTFVPFLRRVAGWPRFLAAVIRSSPRLVLAAALDRHRDAAKAAMLRALLRGRSEASVRAQGEEHARDFVERIWRRDMRERLDWHRSQGHAVAIVSASPTLYLDAVGRTLGVDAVLATELEVGADGRLTGELAGRNVRRAEKVRRLEAWLGTDDAEIWAYGDSTGDHELLERADHATRVG
jgi:phosphatidylglycerophosphatase C